MRYFIGFLVTIGLIVLIIILLLRGGSPSVQPVNLTNYVNVGSRAQLIISGPVVADANHQEIEIDVSRDVVSMTIYDGYERTINTTKSYTNNDNAYAEFIYGLQRANYSRGNTDPKYVDDRGYCVNGDRYQYAFDDENGKELFRFWSTTCGQKTFGGDVNTTLYLFEKQVPDFDNLTGKLNFSI